MTRSEVRPELIDVKELLSRDDDYLRVMVEAIEMAA